MREEVIDIQGLKINYKIAGEGPAVFILHGWGSSSGNWQGIGSQIAKEGFCVYLLDLPGFGASSPPLKVWGISEYASFLVAFLNVIGENKIILAGHSVGGQIALRLALNNPSRVHKLILLAPAAVRRNPGIKEYLLQRFSKVLTFFIYLAPINIQRNIKRIGYKMISRPDYVKTYGIMREIFQRVIREDLTPSFPLVTVPTFLIWGKEDRITPLKDARIMERAIPGAQLFLISKSGHNLHVDAPHELIKLIISLVK